MSNNQGAGSLFLTITIVLLIIALSVGGFLYVYKILPNKHEYNIVMAEEGLLTEDKDINLTPPFLPAVAPPQTK